MLLMLCSIMFVGRLSDRVGRKPILWTGSIAGRAGPAVGGAAARGPGQPRSRGCSSWGRPCCWLAAVTPSTLPALFPTMVRYMNGPGVQLRGLDLRGHLADDHRGRP
ncbi:MFS transporter [Pseudonocardia sp. MCCB 268]|nr:MFS transporter [Pseudonocardia cytotoxica]